MPVQKSRLSPPRARTSDNPTILDRIRELGGIDLSKGDPADIAAILQDYKNTQETEHGDRQECQGW